MITVDLISPGGAFTPGATADTQDLTATFSITSGTNTLTCDSATPFVSGDVGKYFMLEGAGSSGAGSVWLFGTISGFTSSSVVTLSTNATKTLTAASKNLIWGTDDGPAFRAFNDWARAQTDSITLTLGSGAKNFMASSSDSGGGGARGGGIAWGVTYPLRVLGNGSSQTRFYFTTVFKSLSFCATFYLKTGTGVYPSTSIYTARLDTASAGTTSLQCKTVGDAALFTSGTWALITGLDTMGTGQPPNPFLYEYVYMSNVNTSTGEITLSTGLENTYSDTWPSFNSGTIGLEPDHGGPATLYALDPGWDAEATFEGITFLLGPTGGQTHSKGRKMIFRDIALTDGAGLIPSGSKEVEFYDCDLSTYQMEIDKITESVIFDNTATGQLRFQSSVNRCQFRNGSTTTSGGFNGTPRYLNIENSTVGNLIVGASSFGRNDRFETSGSTFNGTFSYGGIGDDGDNNPGNTLLTDYTLSSSGVITMPRASRDYPGLRWALPGTRCYFTGRETTGGLRTVTWGPMFTVLSVTADATNIYVQTDWPFTNGFESWMTAIIVLPALTVTAAASTITSNAALQNVMAATSAGKIYPGTYSTATLTGATAGTDTGSNSIAVLPATGGRLVSLKVNVTTPYTGVESTLNWGKATQFVLAAGGTSFVTWNPRFDLKTPGLRTITPSGVTGAVGADANLTLPSSDVWLSHWLASMSTGARDVRAEYAGNPALGPVFTVELIVDQGIIPNAVAPLRLRLRAA